MTQKKAIILGSTGLTGSLLLQNLIKDNSYSEIILFSRSKSLIASPKIKEHIINLFDLEKYENLFKADVVFCNIGTTKNKTKDESTYRRIDYGIPVNAAILAKKNNISTFIVVSALGANEKSNIFYNKTKGEMERDVLKQKINHCYILRPSLIVGNRTEKRMEEKIGAIVMKILQPIMIGPCKKYRAISANSIAYAMVQLEKTKPKHHLVESDLIQSMRTNSIKD